MTFVDGTDAHRRGSAAEGAPTFLATGFTDTGLTKDVNYTYRGLCGRPGRHPERRSRHGDGHDGRHAGHAAGAGDRSPATYSGSTAVLTWLASPSVGVSGYRVYKNGDTVTWVAHGERALLRPRAGLRLRRLVPGQAVHDRQRPGPHCLCHGLAVGQAVSQLRRHAVGQGGDTRGDQFFTLKVMNNVQERQGGPHHSQVPRP